MTDPLVEEPEGNAAVTVTNRNEPIPGGGAKSPVGSACPTGSFAPCATSQPAKSTAESVSVGLVPVLFVRFSLLVQHCAHNRQTR